MLSVFTIESEEAACVDVWQSTDSIPHFKLNITVLLNALELIYLICPSNYSMNTRIFKFSRYSAGPSP